jgi:hypothetical protein
MTGAMKSIQQALHLRDVSYSGVARRIALRAAYFAILRAVGFPRPAAEQEGPCPARRDAVAAAKRELAITGNDSGRRRRRRRQGRDTPET